jgi:hypothetical protein
MGSVSDLVKRGVRILSGEPGSPASEITADFFETPPRPISRTALAMDVDDFAKVYEEARLPVPSRGYGIEKLVEILDSKRLASLPREVKVAAVLASLDAAGVLLADVIRDAVVRDRAADAFLDAKEREVRSLESETQAQVAALRDEIDAYAGEREREIARLREASDRSTSAFSHLQERKAQEAQRLYDVVAHFVEESENPIPAPAASDQAASSMSSKPDKAQ